MTSAPRLGILGGSFNPVHLGHLRIGEAARHALALDSVLFVPSGRPPHKPNRALAPAADRLAMLRLALDGAPGLEVSQVELRREGTNYTIDTIDALRREAGPEARLFFLIGADTVGELCSWHRIGELVTRCEFVPFPRPGADLAAGRDRLAGCLGDAAADAICGRLVRMEPMDISSTDIRARVAAGRDIRGLAPDAVADYIAAHGIYRGGATASRV